MTNQLMIHDSHLAGSPPEAPETAAVPGEPPMTRFDRGLAGAMVVLGLGSAVAEYLAGRFYADLFGLVAVGAFWLINIYPRGHSRDPGGQPAGTRRTSG